MKLVSGAAALILALGCHDDERLGTGNTGADRQFGAPTGAAAQQIGTEPNPVPPPGLLGNEPMGAPTARNVIGLGPSGAIGPATNRINPHDPVVDPATGSAADKRTAKQRAQNQPGQQAQQEQQDLQPATGPTTMR
ncbi:MAG: hypothetical protein H0T46_21695 [Deltaproteobacteria bacterium]|nr:hypothetical protein [Deltaproteobacteria bacterium]